MRCPVCKKNIPDAALKCPHCMTRTGVVCAQCGTVNPVGTLNCTKCNTELLKICSKCGSVNLPGADKCRKCSSPFGKSAKPESEIKIRTSAPKLLNYQKAYDILSESLLSNEKKIISISGEKGVGKTHLLRSVMGGELNKDFRWCVGKCTPLTQLTPGGVVQDMLLNLFKLPNYATNSEDLNSDVLSFFGKEFKFLSEDEIPDFINFLYSSKEGRYEDIIINKKRTLQILNKIFSAFCSINNFVFVIDNFDFIDGFSAEFFTNLIKNANNRKRLKLIIIYEEHKPAASIFPAEYDNAKEYLDISLARSLPESLTENLRISGEADIYVSEKEKEIIIERSNGNCAFVEQAISYCFDCQVADKTFILPKTFPELISERLATLKKINAQAHKMLCSAAILGDKLNLYLLKDIFGYSNQDFNDIMSYLVKSNYIRKNNDVFYEFNNLLLWETILKKIQKDSSFEDINVKVGKALSVYTLNTNAVMAMISHNLKENRLAFDIWTRTTRLASYVGDINLYVIAQKQCLALLNEFNENETLNIRYNISERLGKLLSEYDPEEAIEYLPDAISRAKADNDEVKEIDLLSYLAVSCKKTGNYFGDIECADNVLRRLTNSQLLETAMVKASKLPSLLSVGNYGEVINLADNDIIPVLTSTLQSPKLDVKIPLGFVYDTRLKVYFYLAFALAIQGNDRAFEVLSVLFDIMDKQKVTDKEFYGRVKLVMALAELMKGDFGASVNTLGGVASLWELENIDADNLDAEMCENINNYNLISAINRLMLKDYEGLREDLFEWAMLAQNSGCDVHKNLFKTFLGKIMCDTKQARRALEIYNEQVSYFADKKLAFGALLCWYLIAEATVIAGSANEAVDTAQRALEIAQNPNINNLFFVVLLRILLAKVYLKLSDYESTKMHLDYAQTVAKKYGMNDLLSKIYLVYAGYYQELGSVESPNQAEYLTGAKAMYDRAFDTVVKLTRSVYMKETIAENRQAFDEFCKANNFNL